MFILDEFILFRIKKEKHDNDKTFHSHRVSVPFIIPRVRLSRLELPALDCSQIDIRITYVDNPSLFYAQYAHKVTDDYLNELSYIISYELEDQKCDHNMTRIGDLVIGQLRDRQGALVHGRARIDDIRFKPSTKEIDEV